MKDLVVHLVRREFELRYRRSVLGWLWALAQPLSRLFILSFAFTRILPLDIPDYPTFLLSGILVWQWFVGGVLSATTCLIDRRDLLFRPGLPRIVVPLVSVLTDSIDFLIALPILVIAVQLNIGLTPLVLVIPLFLVMQAVLILGLGLWLCVANVYLRDVRLVTDLILSFGFYLTPIFYDPAKLSGVISDMQSYNPVARLLSMYRAVLLYGDMPSLGDVLTTGAMCASMLIVGVIVFQRTAHSVVDEL